MKETVLDLGPFCQIVQINPMSGEFQVSRRRGLVVICGPMAAGKTRTLIQLIRALDRPSDPVACFKPTTDRRSFHCFESRCRTFSHPCTDVCGAMDIYNLKSSRDNQGNCGVVAIDEAQFLPHWDKSGWSAVEVIHRLVSQHNMLVLVAGLDLDWRGEVFGSMGHFLAHADQVIKVHSRCVCGNRAIMTYRSETAGADQIVVGGDDIYTARCRMCWVEEMRRRKDFASLGIKL